jgi:hypothetical protein
MATLLELLNTYQFDPTKNPNKEKAGMIKPNPTSQFDVDNKQVLDFIKATPKIYGTDIVRITTETDPHETKAAIKKAATAVVGGIGSIFGPVGKIVGSKLGGLVSDFNPKFPDDFLDGLEQDDSLTFNRYRDLYSSNYANGKYYNGGVKNSKTLLGNFLQSNKTPEQIKDALLPTAKTLAVGLAIGGLKKLFGGKKKKSNTDPAKKQAPPVPFFPSTFVLNSKTTIGDSDLIAIFQEQQRRNGLFPALFGKELSTTHTIGKDSAIPREDNLADLVTIYTQQYDANLSVNNDMDKFMLYGDKGYYSPLMWQGTTKDKYARVGMYDKDVLRRFDITNPTNWTAYPTIKDFEDGNPIWNNLIVTGSSLNYGTQTQNEAGASFENNIITSDANFNYIGYRTIGGKKQPIRYNTSASLFSKKTDVMLSAYTSSASASLQSQNNIQGRTVINPYLDIKDKILNDTGEDIINLSIGGIKLFGTITGLTDNTTPSWTDVKSVGSGFKFYMYDSWEREISFKFQLYADNEKQRDLVWNKANKIKQLTLPVHGGNLGVFGKLIPLQIGNIINEQYGFLTECNTTIADESPWDTTMGKQKPFIVEVSVTYKVVVNKTDYSFYKE